MAISCNMAISNNWDALPFPVTSAEAINADGQRIQSELFMIRLYDRLILMDGLRAWNMGQYLEERVIYQERFQARSLDFRGECQFVRYDECEFVKCELLIDDQTENLAFTHCTFEDCNISEIETDADRGVMAEANIFKIPIAVRQADFEKRLTNALSAKL